MADSDAHRADDSPRPRVALALGSGGARGYAHIGVIYELRDRGYQIVGIAGSSMGALVGGLQAAERLDEFAYWAQSLTQRAILRLLDPSITAAGVLRAEKILDAVRDILGAVTIEQLSIPYTAVATDLLAGKSVWLQRGPVDEAIRASIAIPGGDRAARRRWSAARRRRDPRSAADGADRRGQRRSDHRRQPVRQRRRRQPRARTPTHDRVAEPHAPQHLRDVRHRRRPFAARSAHRAGGAQPVRRGDSGGCRELREPCGPGSPSVRYRARRRRGTRRTEARWFRGDEPHHRHRTGRFGAPHAGRLPA